MTEWINKSGPGWIRWNSDMHDAWEAWCEAHDEDPAAIELEHPEHHVFEEWVASYD